MEKPTKRPLHCFECGHCTTIYSTKDNKKIIYHECHFDEWKMPVSEFDRCHHGLTIIDE